MLWGHEFDVYRFSDGWAWGQSVSSVQGSNIPGYIGYVRLTDLSEKLFVAGFTVTGMKAPVFSAQDIKAPILRALPLGALVSGELNGEFLEMVDGFVHHRHVRDRASTPTMTDFVAVAENHLNLPYIWGGLSTDGLDCSGLVLSSLRAVGQDAPRDADMQSRMGKAILPSEPLKRGDLIFWKGHVGILQNTMQFIHANAHHMAVASEKLETAIERIAQAGHEVIARRRIIG